MRRLRLYLDTSTISEIDSDSERGEITREFFRIVSENPDEYELIISHVTVDELLDSPPEKRDRFIVFLEETTHTFLPANDDTESLARLYVAENVLPEKHIDDLTHVAYAVVAHCNYVISWNMKHIVKANTISRVNEVNVLNNYSLIMHATPQIITGEIK